MRFCLEFVPCCGSHGLRREVMATEGFTPRSEETRALIRLTSEGVARRNRRRGRMYGRRRRWKPTLTSISESNGTLTLIDEKSSSNHFVTSDERVLKRKTAMPIDLVQGSTQDYRGNSFSSFLPTFSATPVMF